MGLTYQQRAAANFTALVATKPGIKKALLAEDMGISQNTLRQRLRAGDFRLSELEAAARIFKVTIRDILPTEDAA